MNQTRTFLVLVLLFVAYLLWNQWENDYARPAATPTPSAQTDQGAPSKASASNGDVPDAGSAATPSVPTDEQASASTPSAPGASAKPSSHGQLVTVSTPLLRLTIDTRGGSIIKAELLGYPKTLKSTESVHLLDDQADSFFVAQSGLISAHDAAPDHRAMFHAEKTDYQMGPGAKTLVVPLTWTNGQGLTVTKRYVLTRGSYQVQLQQQIDNHGSATWTGNAYRQLQRVVPPKKKYSNFLERYSDQSHYSFFGAAWYSPGDKFSKLAFDKFGEDPLKRDITGGWLAMVQHYFMTAWIPPKGERDAYASATLNKGAGKPRYLVRAIGPQISVAPGKQATSHARLYVGPKLRDRLAAVAPGMDLAVDYGFFTVVAVPLHWVLDHFHALTGNWGVAIILLVLLINVIFYKANEAQYKSAAKMRKLKPRMDSLKERYGDDKQKMQQAMMELYKKEKINPVAGCWPMLIQIPVFFALYTVLRESVELRQAPFFGWIHDLSAADPYFVLPVLYMLIMLATQFMMPTQPGMDPTQQKMMRFMPIAFSVIFAFFPAGLVLYYTVNSLCRLGMQWWITRRIERGDDTKRLKKA
ncbi:membrane protein insertase YidC [Oleiagrimonas sp. C23AA]|uniref:membrane protein insertase YidC n=1 Tax=Oleiagrimonas sp. C23AA TaxID=2719047 RepID=UPI001420909F|nr:membrane protein insertase YidC [Oleiagrimonas sp. C23AA]NII10697.1 membrane protein insertase YidC [Oleiagrimonas sp. C23AA]